MYAEERSPKEFINAVDISTWVYRALESRYEFAGYKVEKLLYKGSFYVKLFVNQYFVNTPFVTPMWMAIVTPQRHILSKARLL